MRIKNFLKPNFKSVADAVEAALAGDNFQAFYSSKPEFIQIHNESFPDHEHIIITLVDDEVEFKGEIPETLMNRIIKPIVIPRFLDYNYQIVSDEVRKTFQNASQHIDNYDPLKDFRWLHTGFVLEEGIYKIKAILTKEGVNWGFTINISIVEDVIKLTVVFDENYDAAIKDKIQTYIADIETFFNVDIH